MRAFGRQDRATAVVVALVVLSFLLMTFDIRSSGEGVPGTLREGTQSIFAPFQKVATRVITPVVDFVGGLVDLAGLRDENARLRQQLEEVQAELDRVAILQQQLADLQAIVNLRLIRNDVARIPAAVFAGVDSFDTSFNIDKGIADGVLAGNPVVDSQGILVGHVRDVSENQATVVPLVAFQEATEVTIGEQVGVLRGRGNETVMELNIIDADRPVREGDNLYTSNSSAAPEGILVGKVLEGAAPEAGQIIVSAQPLVDLARLRFVVVLQWPLPEEPGTVAAEPAEEGSEAAGETGGE